MAAVIQFQLREAVVEFAAERHELAAAMEHIFRSFAVKGRDDGDTLPSPPNAAPKDGWRATVNGEPFFFDDFTIAVWSLEDAVAARLLKAVADCLLIHAAAVADGERVILLVGPSGSGKTTSALELVRRGWLYITDEFTVVEPTAEAIHPFPRSATRKFEGLTPAGTHFSVPDEFGFRSHMLPDNRSHLEPLALESCLIVFPRYQADSAPSIRAMTPAEASARLMPSIFDFEGHERRLWPILANLTARSRAYEFNYRNATTDLDLVLDRFNCIP